jgi:protocatechuate 3,4-dioxygenase beta subunit
MHDDDTPIGRILTRREVLALLGGTGAAFLAACAPPASVLASPTARATTSATAAATGAPVSGTPGVPSCVVRPALTEGPYFIDEKLNRADIRTDPSDGSVRPGAVLTLAMTVWRVTASSPTATSCASLGGATVDIWHCDALGVYSDASDPSFNTKGKKFLRGYQTTDLSGKVQFTTIYPGWYQGRAVHIHFKIRTTNPSTEFTSQLFFDEAMNDQVFAQAPYSQKTGQRLRNSDDGIFRQSGDKLTLQVTKSASAYAATFDIGLAS